MRFSHLSRSLYHFHSCTFRIEENELDEKWILQWKVRNSWLPQLHKPIEELFSRETTLRAWSEQSCNWERSKINMNITELKQKDQRSANPLILALNASAIPRFPEVASTKTDFPGVIRPWRNARFLEELVLIRCYRPSSQQHQSYKMQLDPSLMSSDSCTPI